MSKKYIIAIVCLACVVILGICLYTGKDEEKKENGSSESFDSVFEHADSDRNEDSSQNVSDNISQTESVVGDASSNENKDISASVDSIGNDDVDSSDNNSGGNTDNNGNNGDEDNISGSDNEGDESKKEEFTVGEDTETKYGPIY